MTGDTAQHLITRLDEILDAERAALLRGDIQTLERHVEEKEALIAALNALAPTEAQDLPALQDKARHNQALYEGALDGLKRVASRIAAFRRIRESLETYDEAGRRRTIRGTIDTTVEKRA